MKKIISSALLCTIALLTGGCSQNFKDINAEEPSSEAYEISYTQVPTEQNVEISIPQQPSELVNTAIHNNEHNIYNGNIANEEIRMIITRTDDDLSAACITRSGKEKTFHGKLKKDADGFTLDAGAGDFLDAIINAGSNDEIIIKGEGTIDKNEAVFTLSPNTFFPIGEDTNNYYFDLGYDAKSAERFANLIKTSVNDKTAFAKLIRYPISINTDGGSVFIENETDMLETYDDLFGQSDFKNIIEQMYTKYMFANYMGICVEDGIIWYNQDSVGEYKITTINLP